jgi:hypothetical protein
LQTWILRWFKLCAIVKLFYLLLGPVRYHRCHSLRGHKLCKTVSAPSILTLSLIPLVKIHILAIQKGL